MTFSCPLRFRNGWVAPPFAEHLVEADSCRTLGWHSLGDCRVTVAFLIVPHYWCNASYYCSSASASASASSVNNVKRKERRAPLQEGNTELRRYWAVTPTMMRMASLWLTSATPAPTLINVATDTRGVRVKIVIKATSLFVLVVSFLPSSFQGHPFAWSACLLAPHLKMYIR